MERHNLLTPSGSAKYFGCRDPECGGMGEVRFFDGVPHVDCFFLLKIAGNRPFIASGVAV